MYNLPKLQCINRGGCRMVAKNSKVPKFRNFGVLTGFGVSPENPVMTSPRTGTGTIVSPLERFS